MVSQPSDLHRPSKDLTNSEDRLAKIVSSKSHQTRDLCVTSASGARITPSLGGGCLIIPLQSTIGQMRNAAKWRIVLTEW